MDDFTKGFREAQQAAQRLAMQVGQHELADNIGRLDLEDYRFLAYPRTGGVTE